jgi:hypothetical protein
LGSFFELADGAFNLRSSNYLQTKVKTPSNSAAFVTLSISAIDSESPLFDLGKRLKPLKDYLSKEEGEFLVVSRSVPMGGSEVRTIITVGRRCVEEGKVSQRSIRTSPNKLRLRRRWRSTSQMPELLLLLAVPALPSQPRESSSNTTTLKRP